MATGYNPDLIVAIEAGVHSRPYPEDVHQPPDLRGGNLLLRSGPHPSDHPTKIQWIDEVANQLTGKNILLIDEVDDTATTLAYCVGELLKYKPKKSPCWCCTIN
jgi:hypothetical protein